MSKQVLIIDQDLTFCQSTLQALEPLGLDVTYFQDPDEGMDAAQRLQPELIILSAEVQGYSLCRKLRKPPTMASRIMITSEREDKVFEAHQKREGAADVYLIKPLSESEVISQINKLLNLGLNPQLFGNSLMDASLDHLTTKPSARDHGSSNQDELRTELESKDQHINFLKKEMDAYRDGYSNLENTLKITRERLEASDGRLRDLETKLLGLEGLEDDSNVRRSHELKLAQSLDNRDSQLAEAQAETIRLRAELKRLKESQQEDKQDASSKAQAQLERRLEDAQKEQANLRRSQEESKSTILEQKDQVQVLREKNNDLTARFQELERKHTEVSRTLDQERLDLKLAREEIRSQKRDIEAGLIQLKETQHLRQDQEQSLAQIREALISKETELKEAGKKQANLTQTINEVQDTLARRTNELAEAKSKAEQLEQNLASLSQTIKKEQDVSETLLRRKETLEKNLEEVEREKVKTIERLQEQIVQQKLSFDDSRSSQNREHEVLVRNLKEELARTRKESEGLISTLTQEKANQIEQMRTTLRQMKTQLETAESDSHSRKEEIFTLNKRIRQLEETHSSELTRIKNAHETESGRSKFQFEEDLSRLKIEHEKILDERNKQITAMGKSNKEYEARVVHLESKITQIEQERDSERAGLSKRIGEVESSNSGLSMALQKSKEEHQESQARHSELDRLNKLQVAAHTKEMADLKKTFAQDLAEEKSKLSKSLDRIGKLEVDLDEMYNLRDTNENLKRELEKARLGNSMLQTRIEAARQAFSAGLQELHGTNEKLVLEME